MPNTDETLSDEDIQKIRNVHPHSSYQTLTEDLNRALNTIEAMQARERLLVEALKTSVPMPDDYGQHLGCYIHEHWSESDFNRTKLSHYEGNSLSAYKDNCDCGAFKRLNAKREALSTIPAEALEAYRLEREVVDVALVYRKALDGTVAMSVGEFGKVNDRYKAACKALEAHREKVKA